MYKLLTVLEHHRLPCRLDSTVASAKLQLSYKIMFGYVQKLQIAHLVPLKTILSVITNFPRQGRAGPVFRLDPPGYAVKAKSVNAFKNRLDKEWGIISSL